MKYMLDQLIVMNVYTTVKSNLCIMHHSVKGLCFTYLLKRNLLSFSQSCSAKPEHTETVILA